MAAPKLEHRVNTLERQQAALDARIVATEQGIASLQESVDGLRRDVHSDFNDLLGRFEGFQDKLEMIHRQLASSAGARAALIWVFGAVATLASLGIALRALVGS